MLDEALGLLDDHLGNLHMARGRLVKCRGHDLAFDHALHLRNLFRALVYEQHDEDALRVERGNGMGHILQQHGLAGFGRGDDQAALAFAYGGHEIDDAGGQILLGAVAQFKAQPGAGKQRREVFKKDLVARILRLVEVDAVDLEQREISRHNKEIIEKISALYGKKAKAFLSQRLSGNFALGFKIKNDADFSLKIAELIYKHGGILQKSLKSNGTIVVEDDCRPEIIEEIHKRNLKTITVSEILETTRME